MMKIAKRRTVLGALVCSATLAASCLGCAPAATERAPTDGLASNDMVVKGEYTPYDPAAEAEVTAGAAIEGSEEEQLQQERIAGGAAGGVVSENLEPLEGITDYSEGEYVPVYGIACHTADGQGAGTQVHQSHADQNLADEDCLTCHEL